MTSVRVLAPAKVNLGLSILGKRPDGYHEIDTIMAKINLCDEITISAQSTGTISISGMSDVPVEKNLMTKAALAWSNASGLDPGWHIDIQKHIPSPAGIGGGSSDAAAVLVALNALYDYPLDDLQMHQIAAGIGADCPFFLNGPCARATGIGTDLRAVTQPAGWVVLAIPEVNDTGKTATLYGSLTADDYGTSTRIDTIEKLIDEDQLGTSPLPNSFLNPAMAAFPAFPDLHQLMREICATASLSGAGPALFAIGRSSQEAIAWADRLRERAPDSITVVTAEFLTSPPQPKIQR